MTQILTIPAEQYHADVEEKANLPHAGWSKEAFLFGKVRDEK